MTLACCLQAHKLPQRDAKSEQHLDGEGGGQEIRSAFEKNWEHTKVSAPPWKCSLARYNKSLINTLNLNEKVAILDTDGKMSGKS